MWLRASITPLRRLYITGRPSVKRRKITEPTKIKASTISYLISLEIVYISYWKELGRTYSAMMMSKAMLTARLTKMMSWTL